MSTTAPPPARLSPGDTVRFRAPSGTTRQGRVEAIDWAPRYNAHARYRITVSTAGTTITVTPAALL